MKTLESLVRRFVEDHPGDAARALEELKIDEAIKILVKLPSRLQYLLMERISPQKAGRIL